MLISGTSLVGRRTLHNPSLSLAPPPKAGHQVRHLGCVCHSATKVCFSFLVRNLKMKSVQQPWNPYTISLIQKAAFQIQRQLAYTSLNYRCLQCGCNSHVCPKGLMQSLIFFCILFQLYICECLCVCVSSSAATPVINALCFLLHTLQRLLFSLCGIFLIDLNTVIYSANVIL